MLRMLAMGKKTELGALARQPDLERFKHKSFTPWVTTFPGPVIRIDFSGELYTSTAEDSERGRYPDKVTSA